MRSWWTGRYGLPSSACRLQKTPSSRASGPGAYQNPSRYSLPMLDKTLSVSHSFLELFSCCVTEIVMSVLPRSVG